MARSSFFVSSVFVFSHLLTWKYWNRRQGFGSNQQPKLAENTGFVCVSLCASTTNSGLVPAFAYYTIFHISGQLFLEIGLEIWYNNIIKIKELNFMEKEHIEKRGVNRNPHWLSDMTHAFSNQDLAEMYEEIIDFRNTGVLKKGERLRTFSYAIDEVTKDSSFGLRMAEDAILMEMAGRFYDAL